MPALGFGARDVLYDGPDGVTCEYFNLGGRLVWTNRGGDWLDRHGTPQGNIPYVKRITDGGRGKHTLALDVTALVNEVRARQGRRVQILLRTMQQDRRGSVQIYSREAADPMSRPRLVLKTGAEAVTIEPSADAELNCTSRKGLGTRDVMRVGDNAQVAMEFLLPPLDKPVAAAELRLTTTERRTHPAEIAVFRLASAESSWNDKPRLGIAARYPNDAGIESDPSVLFVSRFDARSWRDGWSYIGGGGNFTVISTDPELGFQPLQGKALRVNLAEGKKNGLNMGYRFRDHRDGEPEEVYFRYYLRFADDWNPTVTGGKLPGLAGTYDKGGWGGRRSDGTNGWSMRGSFHKTSSKSNPVSSLYAIGTYAYHADMKSRYGEDWNWPRRGLGLLEKNRWYCIEQYVKLNTPGAADGVMRAWVDGRLAFERTDIRFRTVPTLKIEQVWMNVYHGGTEPSPHDQHLYIDNVVVARSYIGPMVGSQNGAR